MPCRHYCGRFAACNTCNPPISAACLTTDDGLRPFEKRCDRPFRNLSEIEHAGLEGLNAAFPIGSLWEYGPFVEGQDPVVVRVIPATASASAGGPAFTCGENYSKRPEDACALGKPTWFIQCEVVRTPFGTRTDKITGYPPHTLVPHRGCETCCSCREGRACYNTTAGVLQSQRAEIEALQEDLRKAHERTDELTSEVAVLAERNAELHRRHARSKQMIADARTALSSRTGLDR